MHVLAHAGYFLSVGLKDAAHAAGLGVAVNRRLPEVEAMICAMAFKGQEVLVDLSPVVEELDTFGWLPDSGRIETADGGIDPKAVAIDGEAVLIVLAPHCVHPVASAEAGAATRNEPASTPRRAMDDLNNGSSSHFPQEAGVTKSGSTHR